MKETINKIKTALEEAYQEHARLDSIFGTNKMRIETWEREIDFIKQHPKYKAPLGEETLTSHIKDEQEFNTEIVEKIYALEDLIKSLETACRFADLFEDKYLEEE